MHTGSRTQIAGATDSVAEGVPPTVIVTTRPRSHTMWWACFQDKGINEIPITAGLRGAGACLSSRNCYPKVCECKSLLSTRFEKYDAIVTSRCNRSLRKRARNSELRSTGETILQHRLCELRFSWRSTSFHPQWHKEKTSIFSFRFSNNKVPPV